MLHHGSSCSLSHAMDGHIVHHGGIISSCQSAATSKIVKHVFIVEQRYIKYRTFTFFSKHNFG